MRQTVPAAFRLDRQDASSVSLLATRGERLTVTALSG